jgi:predicted enzyme related to lactoylglutathione lyase
MALNVGMVTIDTGDPRALSAFWSAALDMKMVSDFDGEYVILKGAGDVAIGLQKVPERRSGKNRVHLDLSTQDRAAEVRRLVALGATVVEEHGMTGYAWTVLSDPDGNVFCVGAEE